MRRSPPQAGGAPTSSLPLSSSPAGHAAILLNQMTEMRPECSPDGNFFGDLSLLFAVRCAVKFHPFPPTTDGR
jgi:hypothetical protein